MHHPLPLRLSVLLGELLHNLRSGLDHVAWQLVLANGGTPNKKTSFPVLVKRKNAPLQIVGGISTQAAALAGDLQPYNNASGAPEEDPLHVLSTLNNIDKHREFNIAVLNVTDILEAHLLTEDGTGIFMTFQLLSNVGKDKPITDGVIAGRPPFPANPGQKWAIGVESRLGTPGDEGTEPRRLAHAVRVSRATPGVRSGYRRPQVRAGPRLTTPPVPERVKAPRRAR